MNLVLPTNIKQEQEMLKQIVKVVWVAERVHLAPHKALIVVRAVPAEKLWGRGSGKFCR